MIKCGESLASLPNRVATGEVLICECGCLRAWELKERTRYLTYAPWVQTVPMRGDGNRVWVRLSAFESQTQRFIRERA